MLCKHWGKQRAKDSFFLAHFMIYYEANGEFRLLQLQFLLFLSFFLLSHLFLLISSPFPTLFFLPFSLPSPLLSQRNALYRTPLSNTFRTCFRTLTNKHCMWSKKTTDSRVEDHATMTPGGRTHGITILQELYIYDDYRIDFHTCYVDTNPHRR